MSVTSPDPRRWFALGMLCTAFFMVVLDSTIVFVAVPSIQESLGFSSVGIQWIITVYILTFGGLLLFGGRTADLLGRRAVFMTGITAFALASLWCGLAWSDSSLLIARVVQGVSAAMLTPAALALVITSFQENTERNKALGIWGAVGGVGATAGLLVGGPITDQLGWEWIFFINVPVGAALLLLSPVLLRESRDTESSRKFDPAGAITVTAGLLVGVYAISEAPVVGWASAETIGLLVASAVLLALFVLIESRSSAPLVRLGIFRSRVLVGGNILILACGMGVDAVLFVLTLYAQNVLGYSALQFGLMMAVMTAMSVVGSYLGQALVTRRGPRPIGVAGSGLAMLACLLLTLISVNGSFVNDLLIGLVVFGLGLGSAFVAANIAALSGVAVRESGLASGVANTSFHVGGALGVAVATTVAVSGTGMLTAEPTLEALTSGYQNALFAAAIIMLVGLVASILLLGVPRSQPPAVQAVEERAPALQGDSP
jgi:EmrB/QacA subfamily drug resistance transporter